MSVFACQQIVAYIPKGMKRIDFGKYCEMQQGVDLLEEEENNLIKITEKDMGYKFTYLSL